MRRRLPLAVVLLLALALAPRSALGWPILYFDISEHSPSVGSISYAGGANPLVGSGIVVDSITGYRTWLNDGLVLPLSNAVLDFTSGDDVSFDDDHWYFRGLGVASIVGDIPALGLVGATLMAGRFSDLVVEKYPGVGDRARVWFSPWSQIDPTLFDCFIGRCANWFDGIVILEFQLTAPAVPPDSFSTAQMSSGGLILSPVVVLSCHYPEPASVLLLGTGLVGLWAALRRQLRP